MNRYTRQIRLAEIGERGQAHIASTEVTASGDVERAYLRGAGFRVVDGLPSGGEPVDLGIVHPAAREVAGDAFRALAVVRSVLGVR